MDKIPSLSVLSFIKAFETCIHDEKDVEEITKYLIKNSKYETLCKILKWTKAEKIVARNIKWKMFLLEKLPEFKEIITNSHFSQDEKETLFVKIYSAPEFTIFVVVGEISIQKRNPLSAWYAEGTPEQYDTFCSIPFGIEQEYKDYAIGIWREYLKLRESQLQCQE